DARPVRAEHDPRGLGIEPEIELVARVRHQLQIIRLRIEAATHHVDHLSLRSIMTLRRVCSVKFGPIVIARAMLVSGPSARIVIWPGCARTCRTRKCAASSAAGWVFGELSVSGGIAHAPWPARDH